jgi:thiol:disulfide interchange protein DsbD
MRNLMVVLLISLLGTPAFAASTAGTEHVKWQVLADKTMAAPGDTVRLALVEDIIPDWHTYWQNPGDSGMATSLSWDLPLDFEGGAIEWPAPSRVPYGPLLNFGYSHHAVYLTTVQVPADAEIGTQPLIALSLNWLVCAEQCIPESAALDLAMPIAPASQPNEAAAPVFAEAEAAQPLPVPFAVKATVSPAELALTFDLTPAQQPFFFPLKPGLIDDAAPQAMHRTGNGFTLTIPRGDLKRQELTALEGVLTLTDPATRQKQAFTVSTAVNAVAAAPVAAPPVSLTILGALGFALLGGMILNLMPCVFPILSMKIISLSYQGRRDRPAALMGAVAYLAGILVAFAVISGLLLGLRAAGTAVGWGFQLQSPGFVLAMIYLLFAMGLSLSGVFEVGGSFTGWGSRLAMRSGWLGSFFTGALAALVATPCTAPLMGAALGFALTQPWPVALAVIEMLGFGMALPFLLLAIIPGVARHMPRPGRWMDRAKQFLAFPLYGSAVWLIWVLTLQAGANVMVEALAGLILIAFAAWAYTMSRTAIGTGRLLSNLFVLLALIALGSTLAMPKGEVAGESANASFIPAGWERFNAARLADLRQDGQPVFIDMSAAWCITCMVNEKVALGPKVTHTLQDRGVALLKGDWTNRDPEITALLAQFGRNGVPLYVYYPVTGEPVVLPQILTAGLVLDRVK